ncbi:kinase-like protein [Phlegmacium glaucopus]|nr:kinase-like protein [Phlegmacium glaucopus]
MDGEGYSDCVDTGPEAEGAHAGDDGQDVERGSLQGLTTEDLHPPDNCSSGLHGSPDHTLVYNAVYQSCRDLTTCGSWDEIRSSTPNRKSKPMHGMHRKNLSAASINPSITEYAPSCFSLEVAEQVPSPPECGAGPRVPPTETSFPDIPTCPTVEISSEIYWPDALLSTPNQYVLTGSPSTYIPLAALGRSVHGKVFAARLKDNTDDNIYTLKAIPKASLEQRGVNEVTKELWILRLITDASLSNKPFPFIQKLKEYFQDEENLFIVLEYFPTTLAHTETASAFRLSQKTTPPGLLLSPPKTYQSEQEVIQALRFLAAELTLGLLFLHRHGIVHQDIKPANLMISEEGHAVIGDFDAASALPIVGQPGGDPFERSCPPSCVDEDDATTYGYIVLQPEDTVTFTPLYAAPELLERKENGLLVYDERADWWSLGVSLYEITTGGTPFHASSDAVSIGRGRRGDDVFFDLLEGLDLTGSAARECDADLDGYLRSLLIHDPRHRLAGDRAKSHPFLEPLQDIWTEIEDLKHPPCPKSSARILYEGDIDLSFDLQEGSSKFDAQCTQILSCSGHVLESLQSPLDKEFRTPRKVFSSPEQNFLESPPFLTRRMEALAVKRPGDQVLWNENNAMDSNGLQESESSVILQQEAFMSYYIESSFRTQGSLPVGRPLSSTASVGRFFSDEHSYEVCSMPRRAIGIPEESFEEEIVRVETSFTDSGLDFPLGSSPESWGHRKLDSFRKPLALRPIYGQGLQGLPKERGRRIHDEILAKPKMVDFPKPDWTFDEKITISLLQAGLREQETSEPTVRSRLSKSRSVAAVSERIIKGAKRRVADALRLR